MSCHTGIPVTFISINEKGTKLLAAPACPPLLPPEILQEPQGPAMAGGGMGACLRGYGEVPEGEDISCMGPLSWAALSQPHNPKEGRAPAVGRAEPLASPAALAGR